MIALLNDVECELDAANLVVGNTDDPATKDGEQQAINIATNLDRHLGKVDELAASHAARIAKLVHNIRVKSKDSYLTKSKVRYLEALSERSFGVLNGSRINIDSDLFKHSRILAEGGESISMVRKRMVETIEALCKGDKKVLAVSHPFACQIAFNALLGRSHVILTKFWFRKGSMAILVRKGGWEFKSAVNLLEQKTYSLDSIYLESVVDYGLDDLSNPKE